MCNIKTKSNLKTVIIYKVVRKTENWDYISPFGRSKVVVGNVIPCDSSVISNFSSYVPEMTGKSSGFGKLVDAKVFWADRYWKDYNYAILKIKLGGKILSGTVTKGMCSAFDYLEDSIPTFAGSIILSLEDITSKCY